MLFIIDGERQSESITQALLGETYDICIENKVDVFVTHDCSDSFTISVAEYDPISSLSPRIESGEFSNTDSIEDCTKSLLHLFNNK